MAIIPLSISARLNSSLIDWQSRIANLSVRVSHSHLHRARVGVLAAKYLDRLADCGPRKSILRRNPRAFAYGVMARSGGLGRIIYRYEDSWVLHYCAAAYQLVQSDCRKR
jgi:hypothetical protein